MTTLISALAVVLANAPIRCPQGSQLKREASASSEWFSCEKNGRREGPFAFVNDGHVASTSSYRNGVEDGESRSFFADGGVSAITPLKAGEKHGVERRFFENGQPWTEEAFAKGKNHGTLKRWRADGTLVVQSEWLNGEPQGYEAWFASGARRFAAAAPLPNTTLREWNERGELVRTVTLVDGVEPRDAREGHDEGMLTCPKAAHAQAHALGAQWPNDHCGGVPRLDEVTGRTETQASVPRRTRAALEVLGCKFTVTRRGEVLEQMIWSSAFHSKASIGE
jgi:hypothetical protein